MKLSLRTLIPLFALLAAAPLNGCVAEGGPGAVEAGGVEVAEQPPAEQVEVVPIAPSRNHFWVRGHWTWAGRWVWVPGHYETHRVGYAWVPGHWARRAYRWVWVAGHWRRN